MFSKISTLDSLNCGQIHFGKGQIDNQTLQNVMSTLQNCSALKDANFIRTINDYVYDIKQVYFNMWNGFRREVWSKLPGKNI